MLTVLLPSLPFQPQIDPMWAEEYRTAQACGYAVALVDVEGQQLYGLAAEYPVLYRGWMLTEAEYRWLAAQCCLLVPYEQYAASHLAVGWYRAIKEFTPPSRFVSVVRWVHEWECGMVGAPQFVKTLVKSFGADSIVTSAQAALELVRTQLLRAHEQLFVREVQQLAAEPEQRFFVVGKRVFGAAGAKLPVELKPAVAALQKRMFYTIDVARTAEGRPIIIEVGDGQVSDVKEWTVA